MNFLNKLWSFVHVQLSMSPIYGIFFKYKKGVWEKKGKFCDLLIFCNGGHMSPVHVQPALIRVDWRTLVEDYFSSNDKTIILKRRAFFSATKN